MIDVAELLAPQSVVPALKVAGKKQLLQELSKRAVPLTGVDEKTIFDTLSERERLGSTGIGAGTRTATSTITPSNTRAETAPHAKRNPAPVGGRVSLVMRGAARDYRSAPAPMPDPPCTRGPGPPLLG